MSWAEEDTSSNGIVNKDVGPKPERVQMSVYITKDRRNAFREMVHQNKMQETGLNGPELIEEALDYLFDKYNIKV